MRQSKPKKSKPKQASRALSGHRSLHSAMRGRYTTPSTEPNYQACLVLRRIINPDTPERDLWFEVLSRAILDLNRKDAYSSNWFFASVDALEPICEALETYPRVILAVMQKFKIWPSARLKTAKTTRIPKPETTLQVNDFKKLEFEHYENDEAINQTVNSDMDFSYNPDHWCSRTSSL